MVALGPTKYLSASQKADRNSVSNRALAASATRFTLSLLLSPVLPKLKDRRHDHDESERQRQENLPAEPHQLVVAVTGHDGLDHGDQEEQETNLPHEPYHTWNPGEGRHLERRQPATEEQHGAEPAHQHDGDILAEHEEHVG